MFRTRGGVAVVGASVAGVAAADAVRKAGYDGPVYLIDSQRHSPYDRPPLSKKALCSIGEAHTEAHTNEGYSLRGADHWADQNITLRLGATITALRADEKTLIVDGQEELECQAIVLAPGARPRALPFETGGAEVHMLRTLDDARRLDTAMRTAGSMVVIGAGFVGLEVASAARQREIDVTIIEAVDRPLAAAIGGPAARSVVERHQRAGTTLLCGRTVERFRRAGTGVIVYLSSGAEVRADMAVVGIGVSPHIGWLVESGLALGDGVLLDERLAASADGVYACGDAANWPNPVFGRRMRIEHWTTAREQGMLAGANAARFALTGEPGEAFAHVPYVWSDQLGSKVQFVGDRPPGAETVVERDDGAGHVSSHYVGRRLTGRTTINAPKEVMQARRQIRADWLGNGPVVLPTTDDPIATATPSTFEGTLL